MNFTSESTKQFLRAGTAAATPTCLENAARIMDAHSDTQPEGGTHYILAESLRVLAKKSRLESAELAKARGEAAMWERRHRELLHLNKLTKDATDRERNKLVQELQDSLLDRQKAREDEKVLLGSIRVLIDRVTDLESEQEQIEVVFDFGTHGPGGLTPAEASDLAHSLNTAGRETA